jgi:hypothetical protein
MRSQYSTWKPRFRREPGPFNRGYVFGPSSTNGLEDMFMNMKSLHGIAVAAALVFVLPAAASAAPLSSGAGAISTAADELGSEMMVQVKGGKHRGWHGRHHGRHYGWNRGRHLGWYKHRHKHHYARARWYRY